MEDLANRVLPNFLHEDFWCEEGIDSIVLASLKAAGQPIIKALGKWEGPTGTCGSKSSWARCGGFVGNSIKAAKRSAYTWTDELEPELCGRCADERFHPESSLGAVELTGLPHPRSVHVALAGCAFKRSLLIHQNSRSDPKRSELTVHVTCATTGHIARQAN